MPVNQYTTVRLAHRTSTNVAGYTYRVHSIQINRPAEGLSYSLACFTIFTTGITLLPRDEQVDYSGITVLLILITSISAALVGLICLLATVKGDGVAIAGEWRPIPLHSHYL